MVSLICLASSGCITRGQVEATIWLNNLPVPEEICLQVPALRQRGIVRRLDTGQLEFVSVCNPKINEFLSTHRTDFDRILDALIPKN
jgi:hypothetical protein